MFVIAAEISCCTPEAEVISTVVPPSLTLVVTVVANRIVFIRMPCSWRKYR